MTKPAPKFYTSPLSQFCAEQLPGDFHYLDGDEVLLRHSALPIVYARETGILRILESKFPGEEIRRSQRDTFPLLAAAIDAAVQAGSLSEGSGVFIVEGEPPWENGTIVRQVRAESSRPNFAGITYTAERELTADQFRTFVRCRRKAA